MEIYRYQTRLFMIMETKDDFSFSAKGQADAANPEVQAWETLMDQYQQRLEGTAPGEKWVLMNQLFKWNTDGTD
jgi:L-rhamnose mutarotase